MLWLITSFTTSSGKNDFKNLQNLFQVEYLEPKLSCLLYYFQIIPWLACLPLMSYCFLKLFGFNQWHIVLKETLLWSVASFFFLHGIFSEEHKGKITSDSLYPSVVLILPSVSFQLWSSSKVPTTSYTVLWINSFSSMSYSVTSSTSGWIITSTSLTGSSFWSSSSR
jgi:hypothetical protein